MLHQLGALGKPVARNHAAGELLEALLEHALTAVRSQHLVIERDTVESGQAARRNALLGRFLLELGDECGEAALRVALGGESRSGTHERGAGKRGADRRVNF